MKNVLLTIAYDGTDFCGWQRQPDQRSVQEEVEKALSIVCAQPIRINGTSRTDAGVHAYGQRANFSAEFGIPVEKIPVAVNGILAGAVAEKSRKFSGDAAILAAEEVPPGFHARFDAVGKKYLYKINCLQNPDLFQRNYVYQTGRALDLDAMKEAAKALTGTKDFKCFQAAGGKEQETTVRTIYSAGFVRLDERNIGFEIIGDGFLYNMVRIIAGTLVDIGLGRKKTSDMADIIESRERQAAGHTAPPQGLYLAEVYFEQKKLQEAIPASRTDIS
ncbi:MAG TPA: tRNA pseudouridine(38-40) synthase TruA [Anaerovoracaceae bacterium]|nr:tRNA pseudouridine(38-40) synthase TruA [Anaerovoracaceae bacterium]